MITDTDITKLKKVFVTKTEFKEELAEVRVELGEIHEKIDVLGDTLGGAIARIENSLDGISGAIHLTRHDRQIDALALATNIKLPN
ncbi:MAG: hypothetical protein Q8P17_01840 [bacterium]|nr:hypothetical protein [bacterium]